MTGRALCVALIAPLALIALATPTHAGPLNDPSVDPFYRPPVPLPAIPHGTLLRSRRFTPLFAPGIPLPARGWQVMYISSDVRGEPIAVTGTVMVPFAPWAAGPRPVIAWAVGTQGQADRCAPSHQYALGSEYEAVMATQALARGWILAMTDYEGLGTPGDHTYMVGEPEGRAVLDSVYAAQQLRAARVRTDAPVGIMGYSQGGDGAARAAELQRDYAGSLNVKGAAVGGTPYYSPDLLRNADGGVIGGLVPAGLIGLDAAYPELHLDAILTPYGRRVVADARYNKCLFEMAATYPGLRLDSIIEGTPLLRRRDWLARFRDDRSAQAVPDMPALVYHGRLDNVVPYRQGRRVFADWCAHGGQIELRTVHAGEHFLGFGRGGPVAMDWMAERFAGEPAGSDCRARGR